MDSASLKLDAPRQAVDTRQRRMARLVLFSFVLTFILARILVLLIMTHHVPSLYLHLGQEHTHIHHLNYGIFLLSAAGAFLIFQQPQGKQLSFAALVYGVGLALTFDEFGMWVHLGGPYWQRASFDAVVAIIASLGLYCAAPELKKFRPRHWVGTVFLLLLLTGFGWVLKESWGKAAEKLSPVFQEIEAGSPE